MPADLTTAAAWDAELRLIVGFVLGYVVILATPGPNMLAVAGIASLHGVRGAAPFCAGVALGAGALGAALLFAIGAAADAVRNWDAAARAVGALLLLCIAVAIARTRPPAVDEGTATGRIRPGAAAGCLAALGAGFCTAATNPTTGAFFASQFLGPLGGAAHGEAVTAVVTLIAVVATALAFFLTVAAVLSLPAPRRAALAWHRPIRVAAATALVLMAAATAWSCLSCG
ncbi:LysE family transporter [Elioraea rosea]|uniref:LysE family transporter n=1 Tax=Elioraea rosea TaxID=2492390 RepID=UPI001183DD66|nr:LysE family transporter [Elioraea rosea]